MKTLKYFLWIFGLIFISLFTYYIYIGGFYSVKVAEEEIGPFDFVMIERYGDYSQTPFYQDSLMKALAEFDLKPEKAFGIYYDNPSNTEKKPEEYHSVVGLILENVDSAKIETLTKSGFRIETMGKTLCTVVHFPKKSNLSVLLGLSKSYPALEKYRKEKNYASVPALEIYSKEEIIFSMEIK